MTETVLAEGAEATLYRTDDHVRKVRHAKAYRHPALDQRLRAERTDRETRLLQKAYQAGVRVPTVEAPGAMDDAEHGEDQYALTMTFIDGTPVKDVLAKQLELCNLIGESIARLHNKHVVHGDLTTSNMLLFDGEVYFIDFGLGFHSQRFEDYATDLHVLQETLESTHTDIAEEAMERILDAYREQMDKADAVLERYDEIAERGRYR